jgi:1-acyl-sn-glycerol-3-phosphate acyltransferase
MNRKLIKILEHSLWPIIRFVFRIKVINIQNVPKDRPLIFISNHNSGALVESHSILFILREYLGSKKSIFGFTHPSLFKIPINKEYFEAIGAIEATYENAKDVLIDGNSLMIFPGGNRQALRSIWKYKENHFRDSHGWAKIAKKNAVDCLPITFKYSHFINPIFISNEWISKILILPWLLGVKVASISLAQILYSSLAFYFFHSYLLSYLIFVLSPIALILPIGIEVQFYPAISHLLSQDEIEDEVKKIMDNIY